MSPLLRRVVIALVAIAVPLQGIAAAAMTRCDPALHGAPVPVLHARADAAASPRAHAMHHDADADAGAVAARHGGSGSADAHDADAAGAGAIPESATQASPVSADAPPVHDAGHAGAKGGCTPCAGCGAVAALPPEPAVFEPERLRDVFVLVAPVAATPFLTGGPERPPRPTPA